MQEAREALGDRGRRRVDDGVKPHLEPVCAQLHASHGSVDAVERDRPQRRSLGVELYERGAGKRARERDSGLDIPSKLSIRKLDALSLFDRRIGLISLPSGQRVSVPL
jgi:hypothetical protein